MIPNWTHHLRDPEEKKRFRKFIYGSRPILDRLLQLSREMEQNLDDKELAKDVYDSPSWAAKQADNIGYRRCLREFQQLLTLDPKDKNEQSV